MATATLTERYAVNLHGVLSFFERIIITGTLPGACYAGGMSSYLYAHGIRIFDHPGFAEPLRDRTRERAQEPFGARIDLPISGSAPPFAGSDISLIDSSSSDH